MHLATFRYFLSVAETKSIRKTAEHLHVSASAISRQIQNLEHSFRSELFERRPSGMYLTEEGRILETHLRRSVRDIELAKAQIDELHGLVAGRIHFATIEGVVSSWLLPAIAEFRKHYPGLTFEGQTTGTEDVYAAVLNDKVDFGITLESDPYPGLRIIDRFKTRFLLAVPPDHELTRKDSVTLADLTPYPLALLSNQFYTSQLLNRMALAKGLTFNIVLELNYIEMLKHFVISHGAITVLPDYSVIAEKRNGRLTVIDMGEEELPPTMTVVCVKEGRRLSHSAEVFIEQVCQMKATMLPESH